MKIVIIDYGAGNVRSVQFALERLGYEAICTNDKDKIRDADKVIFPGVGEASSAMKELQRYGLDELIPRLEQPVLGICLGMQLLCNHSAENDAKCMDIFPIDVMIFDDRLMVHQSGWNRINDLKTELFDGLSDEE